MNFFQKILFSFLALFCLIPSPVDVSAQNFVACISGEIGNEDCEQEWDPEIGVEVAEVADGEDGRDSLKATIRSFVNYFLGFLGLACVVILIWAGIIYMFSLGDESRLSTAKNIIIWCIIGIIVIVFSYAIVSTLFSEFAPGSAILED